MEGFEGLEFNDSALITDEERLMLEELLDESHRLSDTECDFVDQMYNTDDDFEISEKQRNWLHSIYDRVVSGN